MEQQKIDDLVYEIKNLVRTLGSDGQSSKTPQTNTSSSTSADASTKRLIAALGMLASKIENTTSRVKKSADEQAVSAKEFSKSVDALSKSMDDAAKDAKDDADKKAAAEAAANRARLEAAESARRASLSYSEIVKEQKAAAAAASAAAKKEQADSNAAVIAEGVARGRLTKGQALFAKGLSAAGYDLGKNSESLGKSLQQASTVASRLGNTAGSVVSFTANMSGASQGFEKLNPIIDAAAAALSGIPVLSGAAKAAAEASKFLLAQLQSATTAFQTVSQVGGLTAEGMSGLQRQFLDSGMTLQSYTKTITDNSQTLARFGGTVGDGAKTFSKTAGKVQKDFGLSLQRLGYGVDEIGETTAAYIARQTKFGLAQGKTVDQLAAGSHKYMLELDALAKLTGASKDELKKQQDEALKESRFRAVLDEMKASGDVEQIRQAEQLLATQSALAKENSELGKAFRDSVSGVISSEDAVKASLATGGKLLEMVENSKLRQGTEGVADSLNEFKAAVKENIADIRTQARFGNEFAGTYYKLADFISGATRSGTDVTQTQGRQTAPPDKGGDKLTEETVKAQRAMQGVMIQMSELGFTYMPAAAKAVSGFTTAIEKSMKVVNKTLGIAATPAEQESKDRKDFLMGIPKYADGGIAKGSDSGHLAMLHGTEAVIPLKGGGVPIQISGGGGMDAGPVFNPQTETNYLIEKSNEELVKSNVTLSQILEAITGGATVTGGGGGGARTSEQVAQEALAEHDHAHPHGEKGEKVSPELVAQISKGFVDPLKNMNVTSGMMRNDGKTYHGGIDLGGKIGDSIMAPISGKITRVLEAGKGDGGFGNAVEIEDSVTGMKHILAHMDKSMAKVGDTVKAGTQIGTLGNTGQSTAPHLHHEIKDKFGKRIDPSQFYSNAKKGGKAYGGQLAGQYPGGPPGSDGAAPGFGSTAGGAATGNPNIARQGRRAGATQYPAAPMPEGVKGNLDMMTKALQDQGITDPKMINATLANVMKETGGKINVEEDLAGYANTSNERIRKIFGARAAKKSDKELDTIKKDPKQFAEMMYGKDSGMGLGNTEEGDAYKYRGRGAVGLTGKANYASASKDLFGDDRLVKDPELLKDPEMAAKTSAWFMKKNTGAMAKRMGMAGGPKTQEEADLLATSTIAGQAIKPGQGFLGTEALGKVSGYSAQIAGGKLPDGKGVPGAAPRETMVAGAESGPRTTGSLKSALGLPEGGAAPVSPVASLTQSVMGMLGLGGTPATGAGQAGITAGGAPGAIGGDISAITQAMEAQTAATQTAITSGMENLTTQLVDKLGGAGGTSDPAIPALLSEMIAAQRENTTAINKLIQVSTA